MKCSLLFALALRAQCGNAFVGPTGSLALSNCVSAAAGAHNGIVRRGVASTPQAKATATADSEVSGRWWESSILFRNAAGYYTYTSCVALSDRWWWCGMCGVERLFMQLTSN